MADTLPSLISLKKDFDVTIRPAVRADLPKLEHEGNFTKFRNLFRRAFREQQNGRRLMLVADSNNYPVGRLFILYTSSDHSIADGKRRAYLYSFFVMTPFRGYGIGSAMVAHAERVLRDHGFRYVTIAVAKHNAGALRLYERLGYKKMRDDAGRWSYTDHKGRQHNINEPCWILEKALPL